MDVVEAAENGLVPDLLEEHIGRIKAVIDEMREGLGDNYLCSFISGSAVNRPSEKLSAGADNDIDLWVCIKETKESIMFYERKIRSIVEEISDKLGVGRAFDEGVAIRYFEKIDQNEEAKKILNEAYANASKNLRTENRELISAAAATGVFIEGLYLLTSIVDTYPKDMLPDDVRNNILGPLVKGILEREATLDKLIEIDKALLEGVDNTRADFFLYDMDELKASFAKLDVAGKMEAEGPSLVLNDETLAEITQKVASMREKIVVQ